MECLSIIVEQEQVKNLVNENRMEKRKSVAPNKANKAIKAANFFMKRFFFCSESSFSRLPRMSIIRPLMTSRTRLAHFFVSIRNDIRDVRSCFQLHWTSRPINPLN